MSQRKTHFCLLLICFFCQEITCISILPEYILQEGTFGNCDENIVNSPSALLRSHAGAGLFGGLNNYQADQECAVTFQAEAGFKILVQFPFFKLPPPDGNNCTDKILITEKGTGSTQQTEICTKQDFTSITEQIGVTFISDSTNEEKGVVALVTSFHEGVCSDKEFKCDTKRCVSSDLKCDGYDHCIDETDENKELAGCSIIDEVVNTVTGLGKYGILAIAVVAGGVFLTIFITVVFWKYLKKDGKCCECSGDDEDDDNDSKSDSPFSSAGRKHSITERGKMPAKPKKGVATGSSDKGSAHNFVKEDHKVAKKIKVKGKVDPDIEW